MAIDHSIPNSVEGINLTIFGWQEFGERLPTEVGAPFFERIQENLALVASRRMFPKHDGGSSDVVAVGMIETLDSERQTRYFRIVDGVLTRAGVIVPGPGEKTMNQEKVRANLNQDKANGSVPGMDDVRMLVGILLKVTGKVN